MPLFNIVLNKDNDNGGGGNNGCCPFTFGSIMGQEDLFRETTAGSETRVSNALTARIVWATSVDSTSRVYYGVDPLLDQDTGIVASGNKYHEVFISGLALDTLYRFKVESTSSECNSGGETLTSETYWFSTAGILNVDINQIVFNVTNEILTANQTITNSIDDIVLVGDLTSIEPTASQPLDFSPTTAVLTEGATATKVIGNTMIFTDTPSTAVV